MAIIDFLDTIVPHVEDLVPSAEYRCFWEEYLQGKELKLVVIDDWSYSDSDSSSDADPVLTPRTKSPLTI